MKGAYAVRQSEEFGEFGVRVKTPVGFGGSRMGELNHDVAGH